MEFRWIALIALWTLIAGPLFDFASQNPDQTSAVSPAGAADSNQSGYSSEPEPVID